MIRLSDFAWSVVRDHCAAAYPEEACGFLVGNSGPAGKSVGAVTPLANRLESSARVHGFALGPSDFTRAEREATERGLTLVGVYHSHPDHPARPSRADLEAALPFFSYLIVSVREGRPGVFGSYVLSAGRGSFEAETVQLTLESLNERGDVRCPSPS